MPSPSLKRVRLATLLFPPLGLVLLWRRGEAGFGRKLLGTLGIVLFSILYLAAIVGVLMMVAGLEVEWRGGFPPVLTFRKTKPDYSAVNLSPSRAISTSVQPSP